MAHKISQKGLDALRNAGPLTLGEELILEIMSKVPAMNMDNCLELCHEAIDHYGSIEAAIEAFRSGEIKLTPVLEQ